MFNVGDKVYYKGGGNGEHTFATVMHIEEDDSIHVRFDNGNRITCEQEYFELLSTYLERITK